MLLDMYVFSFCANYLFVTLYVFFDHMDTGKEVSIKKQQQLPLS